MSASRKDFEAIALAVRETFSPDARESAGVAPGPWQWLRTRAVRRLGVALRNTNPLFDYARFAAACDVEPYRPSDEY